MAFSWAELGRRLRAELPIKVTAVNTQFGSLGMGGVTVGGGECVLTIEAAWTALNPLGPVSWADDPLLVEAAVAPLVGDDLVEFEGPADLFDCTLVFASGRRVVQLGTDAEPDVWLIAAKDRWWMTGPHPIEHRAFLREARQGRPTGTAAVPRPAAGEQHLPWLRHVLPMIVEGVGFQAEDADDESGAIGDLELRGSSPGGERCTLRLAGLWSLEGPGVCVSSGDLPRRAPLAREALVGTSLAAFDGPSDLFDSTLVFGSGVRVRQLSTDEDESAWTVVLDGRQVFEGPKPAQHRATMAGE